MKFDTDGSVVWTRQHSGGWLRIEDIASDAEGNVYVTGGSKILSNTILTIKYDSSGNQLWEKYLERIHNPSLTLDDNGNVFITGYNQYFSVFDVVLAKYDPTGNLSWYKTYDNGGQETGQDIAIDNEGNVYVTGWSMESTPTLFLMKFDTNGDVLWNRSYSAGFGTKRVRCYLTSPTMFM